jgi:hypothetical protein
VLKAVCPKFVDDKRPLVRRAQRRHRNVLNCCSSTIHPCRILLSELAGYARCFIVHGAVDAPSGGTRCRLAVVSHVGPGL